MYRLLLIGLLAALSSCGSVPTAHMLVEQCVMDLRDEAMSGLFSPRLDPDFGMWDENQARLYCQTRYLR